MRRGSGRTLWLKSSLKRGEGFLTDNDLEEYYKNTEKFKEPEAVRFRYVYVKINPRSPTEGKRLKRGQKEAYSKIKSGSDFGEIAQTYSQDMSRIKGGDVGFVHRGNDAS